MHDFVLVYLGATFANGLILTSHIIDDASRCERAYREARHEYTNFEGTTTNVYLRSLANLANTCFVVEPPVTM